MTASEYLVTNDENFGNSVLSAKPTHRTPRLTKNPSRNSNLIVTSWKGHADIAEHCPSTHHPTPAPPSLLSSSHHHHHPPPPLTATAVFANPSHPSGEDLVVVWPA
jgi:hypothetical protein